VSCDVTPLLVGSQGLPVRASMERTPWLRHTRLPVVPICQNSGHGKVDSPPAARGRGPSSGERSRGVGLRTG
jgi:hypothetical protein